MIGGIRKTVKQWGKDIMNKENKKLAQQRKAQERARAEKAEKWKKILPFVIIAAAAAAIVIAVVIAGGNGKNSSGTERMTDSQADTGQKQSMQKTEKENRASLEYAAFDASALDGCYDISRDKLTYVQIRVKDYGTITAALDETVAPVSVRNFVSLAKEGFYDGLTFHRIIEGFMIQGGDPNGNGTGGSSETIQGEFSGNGVENPITHVRGAISMARSQDPDSASSQFFIVQADSRYLDGQYAGFGYVTDGMDVVDRICSDAKPTDGNGSIAKEAQPVIESIKVIS